MAQTIVHNGDTFHVVSSFKDVPGAYEVWNIGHNAPPGYVPFCRLLPIQQFPGGRSIDTDTLYAVPFDDADIIMETANYGTTPDALLKWLGNAGHPPATSPQFHRMKRIKAALPAWFRLFHPTKNPYETACAAYGLKPSDIDEFMKLDKNGRFHAHNIKPGGASNTLAVCSICGNYLGWYCPDSPNHLCDYRQDDGSYDEDRCRYCGQPKERK